MLWVGLALWVVVLAAYCVLFPLQEGKTALRMWTLGTVKRDTVMLTVDATGTIEPDNSVDLSATASGTLEKVYVKQNEKVTKGQVLATIESKALTSTMKQAQNTAGHFIYCPDHRCEDHH